MSSKKYTHHIVDKEYQVSEKFQRCLCVAPGAILVLGERRLGNGSKFIQMRSVFSQGLKPSELITSQLSEVSVFSPPEVA